MMCSIDLLLLLIQLLAAEFSVELKHQENRNKRKEVGFLDIVFYFDCSTCTSLMVYVALKFLVLKMSAALSLLSSEP